MQTDTAPWPGGVRFDSGGLTIAGVKATELMEQFGTPLVAVDEAHFRARCQEFRESFQSVLWAVKSFPLRALIGFALEEGLDLLASTGGEVDACLRAGAPGERIVFHGNNKSDIEIAEAVEAKVGLLILDNGGEVARVAAAARSAGRRQPVLLRIAPGIDVETHEYIKTAAPDTKFGTPVAGGLAIDALRAALAADGLEVMGIHLHLGSQLLDARPYRAGLGAALDLLAEAREELGLEARVLDIGGGMGTRYTGESPEVIAELAGEVLTGLEEGSRERGLPVPQLIVEPGRAIASGSAITVYRVGSLKDVPGIRSFVAVDGGMSDNIRPALYGSKYTIALASRSSDAPPKTVTIVGRHCESGDLLARDVSLPEDLERGDLLAFASTGAYEYSMSSNYNKVGRPAVVAVLDGGARLIARRETYDDLARLDVE
ncbi:MAG: diaminopimelate decarboxylase [Actinomycetota bacterium]